MDFRAAASSLYAGKVITVGTLLAVYMSTSDEMLPIMISNAVPVSVMLRILACKAGIAIFSGLMIEYVYVHVRKKEKRIWMFMYFVRRNTVIVSMEL